MSAIEVKNLSRNYGDIDAVKDVSFTVPEKSFTVLLGPSGCGKSTILKMLSGLEQVSHGTINIGGSDVTEIEASKRGVSMVFQSYALFPHLNVKENIQFGLKVRKVPAEEREKKVKDAANVVGLTDLLDRKPANLSGGQRQRVALARSIVSEQSVCLMDEPLSNLDAKLRVSTRAQIKNLQHSLKVTTIYVTHDQVEAMTLADRVVVMNAGIVQQVGTPQEIYNKPANSFVASFIGAPAMNLLKGSIKDGVFTCEGVKIDGLSKKHKGNVTLGFRAEDAVIVKSKGAISAPAFSMELLGDMTMVSIKSGGELVSIKSDKNYHVDIGSKVMANISANLCLLFDSETGQMLDN